MSTRTILVRIMLSSVAWLSACAETAAPATDAARPENAGAHHDEPEHEELPSKLRLTDAVTKTARIRTTKVTSLALPVTVELTGELVADPDASAEIPARAPGRITEVHFKEGELVRAGALLVVLESPELAHARATVTTAKAKAEVARSNANRLASLAQRGLTSGLEVASAEADAQALEAEGRAALQSLSAYGMEVGAFGSDASRPSLRTPIGGFVLSRNATRGQSVEASTVVATVANLTRAYFLGRLFEKDLARIAVGAPAEVRLNAYPDQVFTGVVEAIGRQLDSAARTVVARIAIQDTQDHLKVGLFGTARVSTPEPGVSAARLVVPASAVTRISDREAVFVKHADGDFELHKVTLGRSAEGKVEILSGLRDGEEVVTEGVFTLKSIVLKGTFGEDE